MPDDLREPLSLEVSDLYIDLMRTLDGASTGAIRSALAMAILMTGEHLGLSGQALADWIDGTGDSAKAVLQLDRTTPPLH